MPRAVAEGRVGGLGLGTGAGLRGERGSRQCRVVWNSPSPPDNFLGSSPSTRAWPTSAWTRN